MVFGENFRFSAGDIQKSCDELRDTLRFITLALYESSAHILPVCINAEELYQICRDRTRGHDPAPASPRRTAERACVKVPRPNNAAIAGNRRGAASEHCDRV